MSTVFKYRPSLLYTSVLWDSINPIRRCVSGIRVRRYHTMCHDYSCTDGGNNRNGFTSWFQRAGFFMSTRSSSEGEVSRQVEAHIIANSINIDSLVKALTAIDAVIEMREDVALIHSCETLEHRSGLVLVSKNGSIVLWHSATAAFGRYREMLERFIQEPLNMRPEIVTDFSEHINVSCDGTSILPRSIPQKHLDSSVDTQVAVSMALMTAVKLNSVEYEIRQKIMVNNGILEQLRCDLSGRNLDRLTKRLFEFQAYAHGMRYRLNLEQDLLDIPNSLWDSEQLRSLFADIQGLFAVSSRLEKLNHRISWELESLDSHSEYARHQHASRLEKIIICLITVEIVLGLGHIAFNPSRRREKNSDKSDQKAL